MKIQIFTIICIFLLLINLNFISAIIFDYPTKEISNVIELDTPQFLKENFNSKYGVITISKEFLGFETEKTADYSLISNTEKCLTDCSAEGRAVLYSDSVLFENIKFMDLMYKRENKNVDFAYYIKVNESYNENIPTTYKQVCTTDKNETICHEVIDTYKTITLYREVWNRYNSEILKAGSYKWLITGKKNKADSVDWIVTSNGIEFNEWANWTTADCGIGGNVTIVGDYCVHTYLNNGTFNITRPITLEVLAVAGGGGGGKGDSGGGGGGAGGLNYTNVSITNTTYSVYVGYGGIAGLPTGNNPTSRGVNGDNSSFSDLVVARGGGGGGGYGTTYGVGANGGSGGGGGNYNSNNPPGNGTLGQGNNGGWVNISNANYSSAGGGGYYSRGGNATYNGGDGGIPFNTTIRGFLEFFAGGGGGGSKGGFGGLGGYQSGGNGSTKNVASAGNGINGTGGGGGGVSGTSPIAGTGGNGIVILKYLAQSLSINFINQTPADLNSLNAISNPLIINYNITSTQTLNLSSIFIYYKVNSSSGAVNFINGTSNSGFGNDSYTLNKSSVFQFNMDDNEVYPATYFIGEELMENKNHSGILLTGANNYYRMNLLNIQNNTAYNFFEIMATNTTSLNSPAELYFCNSSYVSGLITTNINCFNFNSLVGQNFNHCHSEHLNSNSCHQVIPLVINITSGSVGNVKITSNSSILFSGSSSGNWNISFVNTVTRPNSIQFTANGGNSFINNTFTIDSHLHQYIGNETFYYYVCGNDTSSGVCTSVRSDSIELSNLPPTAVHIDHISNITFNNYINISYSPSFSPNGYPIVRYNISLLNQDLSFNTSINSNNSVNLSYLYLANLTGTFIISVTAYDNLSQTSTDYSNMFTVSYGIYNMVLSVSDYPYVVVNQSYNMTVYTFIDGISNNLSNVKIIVSNNIYNFTNTNTSYILSLTFTNETDYPFIIYSSDPKYNNISGTFIVRSFFYVTFCGFKDTISTQYKNDFAYITAEFSDGHSYDNNLETFLNPLRQLPYEVFNVKYNNGCGQIRLYEKKNYAVRLIDGIINFDGTYGFSNITKSYGTNIFLGKYFLNETKTYNVIFDSKDLHPYFWLFNWVAILFIIIFIGASITLFFMIPDYPQIPLVLFILTTVGILILRVVVWFYLG